MDVAKAAGLPVAFGTAHLALLERAKLQAGQRLLVLGAGGGVGVAAVQVPPLVAQPQLATGTSSSSVPALRTHASIFTACSLSNPQVDLT